jgi:hypothetical protein
MNLRRLAVLFVALPLVFAPVADASAKSHSPARKHRRCRTRTTAKRHRCTAAATRAAARKRRTAKPGAHADPAPKQAPNLATPTQTPRPSPTSTSSPLPTSTSAPNGQPAPGPTRAPTPTPDPAPAPTGGRWIPGKNLTWYWQLAGTVDPSKAVAAYDIDGVDNGTAVLQTLHGQGKKVICYVSAGTYEPGRPDSTQLAPYGGNGVSGWPGEKWLDIRQQGVRDVMAARIRMCADKGFDGLEPDNVDGYSNASGFPLTAADQLSYNRFLADTAHAAGLAVFQKNDGDQAAALEPSFDGVVTEECNQFGECGAFAPYLRDGKPVVNAEYGSSTSFCAADNAAGIMGARFDLGLAGNTFQPCW